MQTSMERKSEKELSGKCFEKLALNHVLCLRIENYNKINIVSLCVNQKGLCISYGEGCNKNKQEIVVQEM